MNKIFRSQELIVTAVVLFLFYLSSFLSWDSGSNWNWGAFIFFSSFLWLVLSFGIVRENQIGARSLFGKFIDTVSSGPALVPFPLYRLTVERKTVIQVEIPDEPENVWKGDDDKIPLGKMPPIRITHGDLETGKYFSPSPNLKDLSGEPKQSFGELDADVQARYKRDPLHSRLVSEVNALVRFKINDLVAFRSNTESVRDAKRQIRDTVTAALQDILAEITPAHANEKKSLIAEMVRVRVEKLCGEKKKDHETEAERASRAWGISIEDVAIILFDWRQRLNQSIADAGAAGFNAQTTITDAEAQKRKKELLGAGDAEAERLLGRSRADALKMVAAEISASPNGELVARLKTMEAVAEKSQLYVVPAEGITGAGITIAEVFNKGRSGGGLNPTPTPPLPAPQAPRTPPSSPQQKGKKKP